jgi:hypothetical protein
MLVCWRDMDQNGEIIRRIHLRSASLAQNLQTGGLRQQT